jgi:hypothetical protein
MKREVELPDGAAARVRMTTSLGTRLLRVSTSVVFAALLIAGVIAIGAAALMLLILLLVRSSAHSRS